MAQTHSRAWNRAKEIAEKKGIKVYDSWDVKRINDEIKKKSYSKTLDTTAPEQGKVEILEPTRIEEGDHHIALNLSLDTPFRKIYSRMDVVLGVAQWGQTLGFGIAIGLLIAFTVMGKLG